MSHEIRVGLLRVAEEDEPPVLELDDGAAVVVHLQRPLAHGRLAPHVHSHEGPVVVAHPGVVARTLGHQVGPCSAGGHEVDVDVAALAGSQRDVRLDVLEHSDLVAVALHHQLGLALGPAWDDEVHPVRGALARLLLAHGLPVSGGPHHARGVHDAVAEAVGEVASDAVDGPVGGAEVGDVGAADRQVLCVAPVELGVDLEAEGDDAGGQRGGGGGAGVGGGASVMQVSRDNLALAGGAGAVR